MILDYKKWQKFEDKLRKREKTDIKSNLKIFEALYKEALAVKVLPAKNPLEGLNVKIKIAKAVNSVPKTSYKAGH